MRRLALGRTAAVLAIALAMAGCNAVLGLEERSRRPDDPDGGSLVDDGGAGDAQGDGPPPASAYAAAVLADAPVVYLRLGEKGGSVAQDESASRLDGAYPDAGATQGVAGAVGDGDTALEVSGRAGVRVPGGAEFAGRAPFTVELWSRPAADNPTDGFALDHCSYPGSSRDGWSLGISRDAVSMERWVGGVGTFAARTGFSGAEWHHVVGAYDGAQLHLYVDGALVVSNASETSLAAHGGAWSIGRQNCECSASYRGGIDEVAVYDKVLTLERVQAHRRAAGR